MIILDELTLGWDDTKLDAQDASPAILDSRCSRATAMLTLIVYKSSTCFSMTVSMVFERKPRLHWFANRAAWKIS